MKTVSHSISNRPSRSGSIKRRGESWACPRAKGFGQPFDLCDDERPGQNVFWSTGDRITLARSLPKGQFLAWTILQNQI